MFAIKGALRAVGKDERVVPKSVAEAARLESTRELLFATWDRIAEAVKAPNTAARG